MDNEGDNVELTHELVEFLSKGNRATVWPSIGVRSSSVQDYSYTGKEQHEWQGDCRFAAEDPSLDELLHVLQRDHFIFHTRRVADRPASTSSGHISILSAYACEVSRWKRVLCHCGLIYLNGIHKASTTQVRRGLSMGEVCKVCQQEKF